MSGRYHLWLLSAVAALSLACPASDSGETMDSDDGGLTLEQRYDRECTERARDDCDGALDEEHRCQWLPEVIEVAADGSCPEPTGRCVAFHDDGDDGCSSPPLCARVETPEIVHYRTAPDGTELVVAGNWCGPDPLEWETCVWESVGGSLTEFTLASGPPACQCACELAVGG